MTVLAGPGTLMYLMDELVKLEETVHPDLRVYRWQPLSLDPPAIFNWLASSPFQQLDMATWKDTLFILARIGVRWGELDSMMDQAEEYSDAFRARIDDHFAAVNPLNGAARLVKRNDMRTTNIRVGEVDFFCFEFTLEAQLPRRISPFD